MTFSELMLQARYRLFDSRTSTGAVITSASSDGSRYSSDVLANLSKRAVIEFYRLATLFDTPYLNRSMLTQKVTGTISSSNGAVALSIAEPDEIIRIVDDADSESIYSEVTAKKFLSLANRNTSVSRKVFTRYYDASSKKVVTYASPIPATTINVTAYCIISIDSFLTTSSLDNLPFRNVDDILLDYIEREARRLENNMAQVNKLDAIINNKVKELGIELLGNKR